MNIKKEVKVGESGIHYNSFVFSACFGSCKSQYQAIKNVHNER